MCCLCGSQEATRTARQTLQLGHPLRDDGETDRVPKTRICRYRQSPRSLVQRSPRQFEGSYTMGAILPTSMEYYTFAQVLRVNLHAILIHEPLGRPGRDGLLWAGIPDQLLHEAYHLLPVEPVFASAIGFYVHCLQTELPAARKGPK